MNEIATFHPSFKGRIGVARVDITPPMGIYARNWGAAAHDVADSIHRPLMLTAITFLSPGRVRPLVLINADLGWWRSPALFQGFQKRLLEGFGLDESSLIFALTHTHSAPALVPPGLSLPGSDMLEAYRSQVLDAAVDAVGRAVESATGAVLDWNRGKCLLAHVRDLPDPDPRGNRMLCGYNPAVEADDTLYVGRVTDEAGGVRATIVNYACHPTTLAWQNTAISPDFVGAMRETVEAATGAAPTLFLQGASGELAPRYQYVGDPVVADRHGRHLGHAALAALEDMEPPGTRLVFDRAVESGAPLAVWQHEPVEPSSQLAALQTSVEVPLKRWPSAEELEKQRAACQDRALEERLRRKRDVRRALGDGDTYRLPVWIWQIGDAVLVGSMAEAYSLLQRQLRSRFPERSILCLNLINGSIAYLPPKELYDANVYQVWQTPFDRGSLEIVIDALAESIHRILTSRDSDP